MGGWGTHVVLEVRREECGKVHAWGQRCGSVGYKGGRVLAELVAGFKPGDASGWDKVRGTRCSLVRTPRGVGTLTGQAMGEREG